MSKPETTYASAQHNLLQYHTGVMERAQFDGTGMLVPSRLTQPLLSSDHQLRVNAMMLRASQDLPTSPTIPSEAVRSLRAKLILEEALETIRAMGVAVEVSNGMGDSVMLCEPGADVAVELEFNTRDNNTELYPVDLLEVFDGCLDTRVVTTGSLSAFGISDATGQYLVDISNLDKFGPGGRRREDGKWLKPADWRKPPLADLLLLQGCDPVLLNMERTENV